MLCCANPHSLVISLRDWQFLNALKNADILIPDGAGIVLASRILGGMIRERITGSDVFSELSRRMDQMGGYRIFLLGSTQRNLDLICKKFSKEYPNIEIAGSTRRRLKPNSAPKTA